MMVNQIRFNIKETDVNCEYRHMIASQLKVALSELGIQLNDIAIGQDLTKWGE